MDHPTTGRAPNAAQIAGAAIFALTAMVMGYIKIGWPPVLIVGGSCMAGFVLWMRTYRAGPIAPR